MNYMDSVNSPAFRVASRLVAEARRIMKLDGFTQEEAYGWIKAWASGAGDGDGDCTQGPGDGPCKGCDCGS